MAGEGNNYFCALPLELSNLSPLLPLMRSLTSSVWWGTFQVVHPPIPLPPCRRHASMSVSPVISSTFLLSQLCALSDSFPQGYAPQSLGNSAQKCLDSSVPVLTHTSSEDTDCYHSQLILGHFHCPETQECISQVVHKRGVPSATGNLLKCKAGRLSCPNMTK